MSVKEKFWLAVQRLVQRVFDRDMPTDISDYPYSDEETLAEKRP